MTYSEETIKNVSSRFCAGEGGGRNSEQSKF